ncbi:MAG: NmrA/HSCARG family protein [Maribacter sp.]|nr:NmrA/HSCARG family protein [Maribacter sp.]
MEKKKTVFITGITGNQGSAVAKHLLANNHGVIGLTRNASSEKANHWESKGVALVEGDLGEPESFQAELNKADAIFLVQLLQQKEKEISQGKRFIDALNPDSKAHFVYSSVLGADLNTGVPHFESKHELEKYIQSKNLRHTILRPASFYENHLFPQVANGIKKGKFVSPLNKGCKQQMIGTDDIGKIAAQVISDRAKYEDQTLSIATDEWEIGDVPRAFSEVLNIPVKYKKLPRFITRLAMGKDLYKMFNYMNKHDFKVVENIQDIKDEFNITGDLKSWAQEHFKTD